ncbi:MAG: DUF1080 domain-containing protein [Planctomycetes bacterium]|nr:DUF1080 domain-containing protein [Planctomycetota bacterium]
MTRRWMAGALVWAAASAAVAGAADEPAEAFLGNWDIRILNERDPVGSGWWGIERADGALRASMVWGGGGVSRIDRVEVADGELRLIRPRGKTQTVFRAVRIGDELMGSVGAGRRASQYFVGRRAPDLCDVSGRWRIVPNGDESLAAILQVEERDGRISGTAMDHEGVVHEIVKATRQGRRFTCTIDGDKPPPVTLRGEIRGDRFEGTAAATPPGGGDEMTVTVRGTRERAWGDPVVLFDGKSLAGWRPKNPSGKSGWKVDGGALVNTPPDTNIVSEALFRDFRIHVEFNVDPKSNSGIYLRGRYEIQILDDAGKGAQPHGNGAVYGRIAPKANASKPAGEWQTCDATLIGRCLTVVLNGETIIDREIVEGITGGALDPWEGEPGPIMLQGDHGRIRFRSVVVTPSK